MKRRMAGAALALIGGAAAAQECDLFDPHTIPACITDYRAAMTRIEEAEAAAPFFAATAIAGCSERLLPDAVAAAECAETELRAASEALTQMRQWRELEGDAGAFMHDVYISCFRNIPESTAQLIACVEADATRQAVILDMASVIRPGDAGYVEMGRWTIDPLVRRATLAGSPLPRCGVAQPIVVIDCTPGGLQVRLQTPCVFPDDQPGTQVVLTDHSGRDIATFTMRTNEGDNIAVESRPTTALRLAERLLAEVADGDVVLSFNDAEGERRRLTFPQASMLTELREVAAFCDALD